MASFNLSRQHSPYNLMDELLAFMSEAEIDAFCASLSPQEFERLFPNISELQYAMMSTSRRTIPQDGPEGWTLVERGAVN